MAENFKDNVAVVAENLHENQEVDNINMEQGDGGSETNTISWEDAFEKYNTKKKIEVSMEIEIENDSILEKAKEVFGTVREFLEKINKIKKYLEENKKDYEKLDLSGMFFDVVKHYSDGGQFYYNYNGAFSDTKEVACNEFLRHFKSKRKELGDENAIRKSEDDLAEASRVENYFLSTFQEIKEKIDNKKEVQQERDSINLVKAREVFYQIKETVAKMKIIKKFLEKSNPDIFESERESGLVFCLKTYSHYEKFTQSDSETIENFLENTKQLQMNNDNGLGMIRLLNEGAMAEFVYNNVIQELKDVYGIELDEIERE